jgi:phosphatidylglycerophosphate synthase
VGVLGAVCAGYQLWALALALWLLSRLLDGLDGALARRRVASGVPGSNSGGYLDICADFVVYGASVAGVAIGTSHGFDSPMWPYLLVLAAYYVNGASLLAFSSIAERTGHSVDSGRSLTFLPGIAGATETIVVHSLWLIFPGAAWIVAIVWAAIVAINATRQIWTGYRFLA